MGCGASTATEPAPEPGPSREEKPKDEPRTVATAVPDATVRVPPSQGVVEPGSAPDASATAATGVSHQLAPQAPPLAPPLPPAAAAQPVATSSPGGRSAPSCQLHLPDGLKRSLLARELPNQAALRRLMATESSAHSYPLPQRGPMWMSKCFIGEFGDAFVQETDLEGGRTEKSIPEYCDLVEEVRVLM